jgi:DNA helicase-2/ATP-dependent DNA helicase PcrA
MGRCWRSRGTGKTRVLTTRLAHILATRRAWPSQILAVTFTNKAAREMKERIGALIGGTVEGMQWLGTFHAIGAKMLRRHAELAGLKSNFTILDQDDQLRLIKQVIEAENIDEKRWPPRTMALLLDGWKNRGLLPKDVSDSDGQAFALGKGRKLYELYQQRLKSLNAADFGDLLLEPIAIMKGNHEILEEYQQRFRYMLVDEYQDTNVAQYLWLRLISGTNKNLCVVGDDDQSIYGWRGVEVEKHSALRATIPAEGDPAGAELPLDAGDFGCGVGVDKGQRGAARQDVVDGKRNGEKVRSGACGTRRKRRATCVGSGDLQRKAQIRQHGDPCRGVSDARIRSGSLRWAYRVIGGPRSYERAETAMRWRICAWSRKATMIWRSSASSTSEGIGDASIQTLHNHAGGRFAAADGGGRIGRTDELGAMRAGALLIWRSRLRAGSSRRFRRRPACGDRAG